jgi:uncharacterized protein YdeI (YjbR/CyaY-like superfamily)
MIRKIVLGDQEALYATSRDEWRRWLERHHAESQGVWLVFYKKHTGRPSLPYEHAVEEALCFGWIDSLVKRLDEDRYIQKFSPRKKTSAWSALNKKRVQRLIRLGRMTEAGLAAIEEAKRSGSWTRLDRVEKLEELPPELKKALTADRKARKFFTAASPSVKKQFLWWLESAKREETRKKRIAVIVKLASQQKTMSDYYYWRAEASKPKRGPFSF